MSFDAPFKLGPFSVDGEGRLSPCNPATHPVFLFRWHDRVVRARLDQADPEKGRLALEVTLARVSSTASAADESLRPRCFALVHWLERTAPPTWRVRLLADHRVWMETETPIDLPITAVCLLTEVTRFALDVVPYLDLMDEIGLTLSRPGGGSEQLV